MAHKIEKALYGPSMWEVVGGAVLGLLAGVAVACVYLVFKPVATVRELPKEQPRGMVYYLPGSDSNARSAGWLAKQNLFAAGRTVQLNEDELNAWMTASFGAVGAPKAQSEESPAAADGIIIPGKPNFKITDNRLQIGLNCTLNWFGLKTDVTVQTTGDFRKDGDHFAYVPEKSYLGSCPLHFIPGASSLLISRIAAKEKVPDEFRLAWNNLNEVVIVGGALKLVAAH